MSWSTPITDGRSRLVVSGDVAQRSPRLGPLVLSAYPTKTDWLGTFAPSQRAVAAELDGIEASSHRGTRRYLADHDEALRKQAGR